MKERRYLERIRCYHYLKVYNQIQINSLQLCKLPKGYIRGYSFDIEADMRWCRKGEEENFYEAGFKFINAEKSCVTFLQMLISDFKNNDLL